MNIGIYSPYIDSFGGGERYMLTIASHWSTSHRVVLFWDNPNDIVEASDRFALDLSRVNVVPNIFRGRMTAATLLQTLKFDCMLVLSDGSMPTSLARRNIIHFQVPFAHVRIPFWKTVLYRRVVVNSEFTKRFLDSAIRIGRTVIYPPAVPVCERKTERKNRTILSVGRFGGLYNAKKHNVLIEVFRTMIRNSAAKQWSLVIAGGLLESDRHEFELLRESAKTLPVTLFPNCPREKLLELYSSASVYWHAAGFGETKPEYMEHFGISTVEAMSFGAVPVVYNGGGQPEIISDPENGFLWNTKDELRKKTVDLISNPARLKEMAQKSKDRAERFSVRRFTDSFDSLLREIS